MLDQPFIRIEGLTRRFGSLTAVSGLSFDVHKNEIFGLLGPNGAGKTTTINMLCGLLPASEGKITFTEFPGDSPKSLIGYCPQENIFYPRLTCLEQLLFVGQMYEVPGRKLQTGAIRLLDLLGLRDKSHVLASKLSGGMKRRLNICLALVHDPEILILDEPESGLDPQSRILVRDFIRNFGQEKTIILSTHNMDEADRLATRIAIIDYGRLLKLDTPASLKKTIGQGDILEIGYAEDKKAEKDFAGKMKEAGIGCTFNSNTVLVRHQDIITILSGIKSMAETSGMKINEIKLRENTLEDVFIHLTGRSLRQ